MKRLLTISLLLSVLLVTACSTPIPPAKIDRHPREDYWGRGDMPSLPTYNPNSDDLWQIDLRAYDLSNLDLRDSLKDLLYADFDSQTVWPPNKRLPEGFDSNRIMELGKNPGLGVKDLHSQGITGRGVSIAIIDQPLLTMHQEYTSRLRLYEEINIKPSAPAQMHGAAVASIAVGDTMGVAPKANLYYIGSTASDWDQNTGEFTYDFTYYARAIERILEINQQLPENEKIRVISMQVGWQPGQTGYDGGYFQIGLNTLTVFNDNSPSRGLLFRKYTLAVLVRALDL